MRTDTIVSCSVNSGRDPENDYRPSCEFRMGTPWPQIPNDFLRRIGIALIDTVGGALARSGEAVVHEALQEAAPFGRLANVIVLSHNLKLAAPALCPGQLRAT